MRGDRIRTRLMVPLGGALLFIMALFTVAVYQTRQQSIMREVEERLSSSRGLLEYFEDRKGREITGALLTLARNPEVPKLLRTRDREALLRYAAPLYETLHREIHITHLYFTGPDRVNILRVHQPDRYGDVIGRLTTLQAQRTGKISRGVELGPLGTLTLRVVIPVMEEGRSVGFVEMGTELSHVFTQLKKVLGLEYFAVIEKEYLDRKRWEAGMDMLGRHSPWDRFPSTVVVDASLDYVPKGLEPYLDEEQHQEFETDLELNLKDRTYRCRFIHLRDMAGRGVGDLVLLYDITGQRAVLHEIGLVTVGLTMLIGGLLFGSFFTFLGKVEGDLRRSHEKILELERDRSRFILENLPAHVFLMDPRGRILQWNAQAEKTFGIGAGKGGGFGLEELLEDGELGRSLRERATRGESVDAEVQVRAKDGDSLWIKLRLVHMAGGEDDGMMLCFADDITARKAAEAHRVQLEKAIEQAAEMVMITDREGTIRYVNPAFEKVTGYPRGEVLGKTPQILKSGKQGPSFYVRMWETIVHGHTWHGRICNQRKDGSLYEEDASITPIVDEKGQISSFVSVKRDVTREVEMERRLRQAQKMEAGPWPAASLMTSTISFPPSWGTPS